MKTLVSGVVAVGICAIVGGCQPLPKSRLIRLMPQTDPNEWFLSVNRAARPRLVTLHNLTNHVVNLHLQHGDIVFWGELPESSSSQATAAVDWLARYLNSKKVGVYIYPSTSRESFFGVPVYHWVAPFENPRDMKRASFFFEGRLLGAGMEGYQNMVQEIQRTRRQRIFVLGSAYDISSGFGPFESPYEAQQDLLDSALKAAATELLLPSEWPGF